jgi:hypothetical protein
MKCLKSRGAWFCSPPKHGRRALVAGDWVPRLEVAKRGGTALNRVFAKVLGEAGHKANGPRPFLGFLYVCKAVAPERCRQQLRDQLAEGQIFEMGLDCQTAEEVMR